MIMADDLSLYNLKAVDEMIHLWHNYSTVLFFPLGLRGNFEFFPVTTVNGSERVMLSVACKCRHFFRFLFLSAQKVGCFVS